MGARRQVAGEQSRDPRPAEFSRRQADSVQHDEVGHDARRTCVEKRGKDLFYADHQAGGDIDAHGVCRHHATIAARF
jgi:hypothetical protein